MIVRMKEILLFSLSSSVEETIQRLGELGVVDIKEINPPTGERIERNIEKIMRTENAISILEKHAKINEDEAESLNYNSKDPIRITNRILISRDFKKQCQIRLNELNQQLKWYETWGDNIDLKDFKYLQKKGIYIRLYLVEIIFQRRAIACVTARRNQAATCQKRTAIGRSGFIPLKPS